MKNSTLILCSSFIAFGLTAQAQVSFTSGGSLTAWNGSPIYTSIANSGLSGASTGQGMPTITGAYGVFAETFTPSSAFEIGSFSLLLSVNNISSPTYEVNLYDLGAAGTVSVSSSSATFGPGTSDPGTSLFSDTLTFSATTSGEVQGTFTLASADQVSLLANEEYAIEIWTPSADGSSGIDLYRGSTADPGGQMFDSASSSSALLTLAAQGEAGGAPRTGALALYQVSAVPEPTSLALSGLGGLAGAFMIRRRNA